MFYETQSGQFERAKKEGKNALDCKNACMYSFMARIERIRKRLILTEFKKGEERRKHLKKSFSGSEECFLFGDKKGFGAES